MLYFNRTKGHTPRFMILVSNFLNITRYIRMKKIEQDMEETIIIIGGLSAGPSAAAKARRTNEKAKIILFEKTRYISYATCGIPYSLSGTIKDRDKLLVVKAELLRKRFGIDVRLEEEVMDIVPDDHLIQTSKGWYKYSKLIFATGAHPFIPPIKNIEQVSNWSNCRTIENFDKLVEDGVLTKRKNITILGAGLIGVEVAENLKKVGKNVSIVEMAPSVLSIWDPKFGHMAEKVLVENGINVYTSNTIEELIIERGEMKAIKLKDGTEIKSDYLIMGIGGRPNTHLLTSKGADSLPNGALKVNEKMETNLTDIYAAGDCASMMNLQTGEHDYFPMGTHSNKGGRTAGANAAGGQETFKGAYKTAIVKVFNYTMARTGMNPSFMERKGIKFESTFFISSSTPGFYPEPKDLVVEVYYDPESGRLLGAEIFGEKGVDKRIDVFSTAIYAGLTIEDLPNLDLAYAPPYSPAKDAVILAGYISQNKGRYQFNEISALELNERIEKSQNGYRLIDVREKIELERGGMIPGAENIDLDELRDHVDDFDCEQEIIVYCAKGLRGYLATLILRNHGVKDVKNLGGGFKAWKLMVESKRQEVEMV